jgi:hypothetical protein
MREPSSIRTGQQGEGRGDGIASALDRCRIVLQQLDRCLIRDARARRWIATLRQVVDRGRAPLSSEEQAAFQHALDQLSAWLEAEPRRLLWQ